MSQALIWRGMGRGHADGRSYELTRGTYNTSFQLSVDRYQDGHAVRKCLDVTDFRYTSGTPLQLWGCTGNWNQTFLIRRIPGS